MCREVRADAVNPKQIPCGDDRKKHKGEADFASAAIVDRMTEEQARRKGHHTRLCCTPHPEQADVAQLVEQLIRNQQVNGSSPFVGSIFAFPASLNLLWFEISTEILQIVALSP